MNFPVRTSLATLVCSALTAATGWAQNPPDGLDCHG